MCACSREIAVTNKRQRTAFFQLHEGWIKQLDLSLSAKPGQHQGKTKAVEKVPLHPCFHSAPQLQLYAMALRSAASVNFPTIKSPNIEGLRRHSTNIAECWRHWFCFQQLPSMSYFSHYFFTDVLFFFSSSWKICNTVLVESATNWGSPHTGFLVPSSMLAFAVLSFMFLFSGTQLSGKLRLEIFTEKLGYTPPHQFKDQESLISFQTGRREKTRRAL